MRTKKKISILFILTGFCFFSYAGYLTGGAWKDGITLTAFIGNMQKVLMNPFAEYLNAYTMPAIAVSWTVYIITMLMYITSRKNYMFGEEYGSSKFGNVKKITKQLSDKEENNNRILSKNLRMSMNTRKTRLNNNILVIGGSGAGKTLFCIKPNIMQMNPKNSYICTDPKGELLASTGSFLKKHGYTIKVLNLVEMEKSNCYNPFQYIRSETDVIKLITNLIANTTPKGSTPSDPFWEKAESLYLQSLFYYVWMEEPKEKRNFNTVLSLLSEAEVRTDGKPSKLDRRMEFLEKTSRHGVNHPAVKQYYKCVRGAGDTVRSIIISANSRLAFLENEKVKNILADDEMDLASIGIGRNGDQKTKTALFCIIPDNDKSYNFLVGLLYSQLIQELYYQADFNYNGRLPIRVSLYLDEFSNVALPDDFCSLLSTMRSREISCIIIIQNMAQIKALFKDTWETIPGNSDTLIYLGGNEQGSHKYISEMLGKGTIDKRSNGESRGKSGSTSRNYDVLGRELLTPDEVRKIDNSKCIVLIRGNDPVLDYKYNTFKHPIFKESGDGKGERYIHQAAESRNSQNQGFELLSKESFSYFETCQKRGENIIITSIDAGSLLSEEKDNHTSGWFSKEELEDNQNEIYQDAFLAYGIKDLPDAYENEFSKGEFSKGEFSKGEFSKGEFSKGESNKREFNENKFVENELSENELSKNRLSRNELDKKELSENEEDDSSISHFMKDQLVRRLEQYSYNEEQVEQLNIALEHGLTEEQILELFNPDYSADIMREIRESIEQISA